MFNVLCKRNQCVVAEAGRGVNAVLAYEMEPDEEERMAALMFAQKAAEASPTVVGAWLPIGRSGGTWMAIMAAQEAAEVSPTTVEAGPPLNKMKRRRDVGGPDARPESG